MFKKKPKTELVKVVMDGDIVVLKNGENFSFYKMAGQNVVLMPLQEQKVTNEGN